MQRTNIYLDGSQLDLLRQLGAQRGEPVAGLVRTAVDEWLLRQGARTLSADEWQQRFTALLEPRTIIAAGLDTDEQQVADARSEPVHATVIDTNTWVSDLILPSSPRPGARGCP